MPGNFCHPCCGLGAVMMLQSQLSPACQANWAPGAMLQLPQLSTEGQPTPWHPTAHTTSFQTTAASPCNTWGFSQKPRAKQSQNWGLNTSSWSATKPSGVSLAWVRSGQPVLCPGKSWAGRILGPCSLFGCSSDLASGKFGCMDKMNLARGAPGQRTGVCLLAYMQPQHQISVKHCQQTLRNKKHTTVSSVKCSGYGMTLFFATLLQD